MWKYLWNCKLVCLKTLIKLIVNYFRLELLKKLIWVEEAQKKNWSQKKNKKRGSNWNKKRSQKQRSWQMNNYNNSNNNNNCSSNSSNNRIHNLQGISNSRKNKKIKIKMKMMMKMVLMGFLIMNNERIWKAQSKILKPIYLKKWNLIISVKCNQILEISVKFTQKKRR